MHAKTCPAWKLALVKGILRITLITSALAYGVRNAEPLRRQANHFFYGRIPAAEQCYQDLYGLRFFRPINKEQKFELYIYDYETRERRIVGPDLLTGTIDEIYKGLEDRVRQNNERLPQSIDLLYETMNLSRPYTLPELERKQMIEKLDAVRAYLLGR
ncbi:hypothetical protein HZB01_04115 [Candidatus Woesearchaeota archaeon]|nr:hypothetical protein [Candidatus Woesearchaeota archaeon]